MCRDIGGHGSQGCRFTPGIQAHSAQNRGQCERYTITVVAERLEKKCCVLEPWMRERGSHLHVRFARRPQRDWTAGPVPSFVNFTFGGILPPSTRQLAAMPFARPVNPGCALRSGATFIFPDIQLGALTTACLATISHLPAHCRGTHGPRAGSAGPRRPRHRALVHGWLVTHGLLLVYRAHLNAAGGLLMTTSTRRFCCRPDAESLSATGSLRPLPVAASRVAPIPCAVKYDFTDSARRSESAWL